MSTSSSTDAFSEHELGEFLNRMLEAERAGAKALVVFLDAFSRTSKEWKILRRVQAEEAHNCALIGKMLERSGKAYSHATGEFFDKAVAVSGRAFAAGDVGSLPRFAAAFDRYATVVKDHYWKERDILFNMARRVLSETDAQAVLTGIGQVEDALGPDTHERYYGLAQRIIDAGGLDDLSFGLDRTVLAAMLNTLPVELSFVDADDIVRYFSHENREKIFGRTRGAIGTAVQNCHPQRSVHMVNAILADFKAGRQSVAEFWIEMGGKFIHIRYFSIRDDKDAYLGCMEVVQDVTGVRSLKGEKRLLAEA